MRIGIDNISLGISTMRGGVGSNRGWLSSLVEELCATAPSTTFVLFSPTWADPLFGSPPANLEVRLLRGVPRRRELRVLYQQTALPVAVNRANLDVFYASGLVVPMAVTVPVVMHALYLHFYTTPAAFSRLRVAYLRAITRLSVSRARRIQVSSTDSANDLIRYSGCPAERVSVIPYGLSAEIWNEVDHPAEMAPVAPTKGRPFVLCVSATYPYKNHRELIRAFGILKRETDFPHVLLLVGAEAGVSFSDLRAEAEHAKVADEVIVAGRVDEVVPLYRQADCFVMPSLYETFGFPVLEAMALGCPVVTSNRGTMEEFAKGSAILVDPEDERSIADGLRRLLSDPHLREEFRVLGRRRADPYRWSTTARRVYDLLCEAAK